MQARSAISVVLSLALLFFASLAGPLHEVVAHRQCSMGGSHTVHHHGHSHSSELACVFDFAGENGNDSSRSQSPLTPHDCDDDCLVCHLLAQALITADAPILAVRPMDVPGTVRETCSFRECDSIRLAHPRGPPAVC